MTVMLYQRGAMKKLHGHMCDYQIVEDDKAQAQLDNGWYRSPADCYAPPKPKVAKKKTWKKPSKETEE